jgi:aspartyl-tRNA(Asn)/glutamyl-tRNA(Gln) amidotransferase subunit C
VALTIRDVEHVALLSRLELTEAEKEKYAQELTKIFDYVEQLKELDVTGVPPTAHALPMADVFREDQVSPGLSNEEALANAPEKENGCFKVPQIV